MKEEPEDGGFGRRALGSAIVGVEVTPQGGAARSADLVAALRERDVANGEGWARGDGEYVRLAMPSRTLADHAPRDARARETCALLAGSGTPCTTVPVFARMPNYDISPRVPAQVVSCAAPAAGRG